MAQHGWNAGNKSLQIEVKNFLLLTSLAIVNEPGHVKRRGDPPGQKSACETTQKQADGESLQRPRGHTSPGRPEQSSAELLVFVPDGTAVTLCSTKTKDHHSKNDTQDVVPGLLPSDLLLIQAGLHASLGL